jgi:hypothetical protein
MRNPCLLFIAAASLAVVSCSPGPESYPVRTYGMGERITLGHLIYQVFERQWLPQLGMGNDARVPQNRFFLVRMSTVNSGGSELMVTNPVLEDDAGKTYSPLSDGTSVPQWIGFLLQVKPADSLQGNLVYDVPPKHYKLRISDDDNQRAAYIDIPLSFDGVAPDLALPDGPGRR